MEPSGLRGEKGVPSMEFYSYLSHESLPFLGLRGFISADLTVPDIRAYLTVTQKGKSRIRSLTHGSLIDLEVLLTMGKEKNGECPVL